MVEKLLLAAILAATARSSGDRGGKIALDRVQTQASDLLLCGVKIASQVTQPRV